MAAEGKGVLFKADSIAETFRSEIKSALATALRPPKLVGILATTAAPSKFYAEFTKKQCDALGVEFVLRKTGAAADESLAPGEGVEEAIIEANEDDDVDGIMVCGERCQARFTTLCATLYHRYTILSSACSKCISSHPLVLNPADPLAPQDHYLQQVELPPARSSRSSALTYMRTRSCPHSRT